MQNSDTILFYIINFPDELYIQSIVLSQYSVAKLLRLSIYSDSIIKTSLAIFTFIWSIYYSQIILFLSFINGFLIIK